MPCNADCNTSSGATCSATILNPSCSYCACTCSIATLLLHYDGVPLALDANAGCGRFVCGVRLRAFLVPRAVASGSSSRPLAPHNQALLPRHTQKNTLRRPPQTDPGNSIGFGTEIKHPSTIPKQAHQPSTRNNKPDAQTQSEKQTEDVRKKMCPPCPTKKRWTAQRVYSVVAAKLGMRFASCQV